jgi:N-acetylglucosamine-6-phosphate deacetylase
VDNKHLHELEFKELANIRVNGALNLITIAPTTSEHRKMKFRLKEIKVKVVHMQVTLPSESQETPSHPSSHEE